MRLSKFKSQTQMHVIVMAALIAAGLYMIVMKESLTLGVVLLCLAALTIISLLKVVDKTNRHLASFLSGIKYDDFEATYSTSMERGSERELLGAFNLINDKFRNIRLEKEMQFQYFQSLVENVETGLIGFDEEGNTILMNKALKATLHKSHFVSLQMLKRYDEALYKLMLEMASGERRMIKKVIEEDTLQLAIQKTQIKIRGKCFDIYSFQNIHEELQANELESWQKLIRILTHEIMNSVTPVISLAHSTHDLIRNAPEVDGEKRTEIMEAILAIQKRTEGLLHFTKTYRKLTRVPPPRMQMLEAHEIMDRVLLLMGAIIRDRDIELVYRESPSPIYFLGDPEQLEQALINLLKNAMEAVDEAEEKIISVTTESRANALSYRITDSGPGIPHELRDQIFVPFFTTKEEGSGVGLSLSRQIIYQHKGSLKASFPPGCGVEFIISLPLTEQNKISEGPEIPTDNYR